MVLPFSLLAEIQYFAATSLTVALVVSEIIV